jgi:hypothetical protein
MAAGLLGLGLLLHGVPEALAKCPLEYIDEARAEENKLKKLLAAVADEQDGLAEVELTEPGTVTTIRRSSRGLTKPRAWTPEEKAALESVRINQSLPLPAGVWK